MDICNFIKLCKEIIYLNECHITGSMRKAAEKLHTHQPIISKAIKNLEKHTGCLLIYRLAQGIKLTKDGEILCKKAAALYDLEHYLDNFASDQQKLRGEVTLWTTDGFGSWCIPTYLKDFYQENPNILLNIICSEELPNIEKGQADVGLVYEQPTSSNSSVISQYTMKFGLCASKSLINKHGHPQDINDLLANFPICNRNNYAQTWPQWKNMMQNANKILLSTNSSSVFMRVTKDGLGISLQPLIVINADDDLVRILPNFQLEHPFWIISHVDTKDFPKVRSLIDYIKKINSIF